METMTRSMPGLTVKTTRNAEMRKEPRSAETMRQRLSLIRAGDKSKGNFRLFWGKGPEMSPRPRRFIPFRFPTIRVETASYRMGQGRTIRFPPPSNSRRRTYPQIKKNHSQNWALIFTDEASFRQDSTLHATWNRVGHPPEVPVTGERKNVKILNAIELWRTRFHYREEIAKRQRFAQGFSRDLGNEIVEPFR